MPTTRGSRIRCARVRSQTLVMGQMPNTTLDTRMDTKITTNRKLVPHRGWCRGWMRTFSTVRGSPAS